MAGEWTTLPLEDCMAAIIDYRGKSPEKTTSGVPLVTAKIVKGGRIEKPEEFIAEADFDDWMRRGMPKPGDIVMTTEAPLGEVAQLDGRKVALAQRVITLRGKPDVLDNTFLKFLLQSTPVQEELRSRGTGTTVVGIRQSELRKVSLTLPPLAEQKAIAAVLGALDDKIELNRRMNATLEAMARALFQSWFVDFDPVRAKLDGRVVSSPLPVGEGQGEGFCLDPATAALFPASFQESALGPIPHGWRAAHLEEIASVGSGKRPEGRCDVLSPECNIPLYGGGGRMGYVPSALYDNPILFTGRVGTLGLIFRTAEPSWPSDNTLIVEPQAGLFDFTYFVLKGFDLVTLNRGSTQPLLTQTDLKRQKFVLPTKDVVKAFADFSEPIFRQIVSNKRESRTLATLRDTLLPQLLSGEVQIPNEK